MNRTAPSQHVADAAQQRPSGRAPAPARALSAADNDSKTQIASAAGTRHGGARQAGAPSTAGGRATAAAAAAASNIVRVYPPVVEFQGVQTKAVYAMTLSIQNVDAVARRIRVTPPATGAFQVRFAPQGPVAPGMDVKAEVEFEPAEERDYHDSLTVLCGSQSISVPLHAYVPAPKIEFDGFVNLGVVVRDNTAAKYVTLRNTGHRAGRFRINFDPELPLQVSPAEGVLQPGTRLPGDAAGGEASDDEDASGMGGAAHAGHSEERVRIAFTGHELGVFRALLHVEVEGSLAPRVLDVSATVVEQHVELVMPEGGGKLETVQFGALYYGEQRTVKAVLVNNGPMPCAFAVVSRALQRANSDGLPDHSSSPQPGGDSAGTAREGALQSSTGSEAMLPSAAQGTPEEEPIISVSPSEGMINPYDQVALQFHFRPRPPRRAGYQSRTANAAGDAHTFMLRATVDCADTKQQLPVTAVGKALKPSVTVSQRKFVFGECPVNDRRDIMVTIKNEGEELPVDFSINKVAHFRAQPATGRLMPRQSQNVVVTFCPTQMGRFKNTLHMVVSRGIAVIALRVQGTGSAESVARKTICGPDKLPEDFKPRFNFVGTAVVSPTVAGSVKRYRRPQPWDGLGPAGSAEFNDSSDGVYTYAVDDLRHQQMHKDKYTEFLRTSALQRREARLRAAARANGTKPWMDPEAADMGIEPRGGLEEPRLALPSAAEGLWLERPMDQLAGATGTERGGGAAAGEGGSSSSSRGGDAGAGPRKRVRTSVHDDTKLIRRKFKPKPSTPAEVRDCSTSLSASELVAVSAGPKLVDFGRVNVNSRSVRSFSVVNDLAQSILVAVAFDCDELRSSGPASQVLPPGAVAGFDVVLRPTKVQEFRHAVPYVINDTHTFKFTVAADVVPVALVLSRDELFFRFPSDSLAASLTERLVLENPGNAPAEFAWSTRGGPFSVTPASGTVPAGSSLELQVTFSPFHRCELEEALVLHVNGGTDEHVLCVGELEETRCAFVEKRADFGIVAVGQAYEQVVQLKNTGRHRAAVWAEVALPGLRVTPERAHLLPGEGKHFTLHLMPPVPRTLDGTADAVVTMHVRGCRSARLPVCAQAVVPELRIVEDEFDFGDVVIGARASLPLTVENEGAIPAVLQLDLSPFPEFSIALRERDDATQEATSVFEAVIEDDAVTPPSAPAGEPGDADEAAARWGAGGRGEEAGASGDRAPQRFRMKVMPQSSLEFLLTYTPSTERSHAFEFPIALAGVPTPAKLRRAVVGAGQKPRLVLSRTAVDFGSKVLSREGSRRVPYHAELSMTNADEVPVTWEIDTAALAAALPGAGGAGNDGGPSGAAPSPRPSGAFKLEPTSGRLNPRATCRMRVHFLPTEALPYSVSLPLYLDGRRDRPYLEVQLMGAGTFPRLEFDCSEIVMPTVPLNVPSRVCFHVMNVGYDHLELRYSLPADTARCPLQLHFPQGKMVGLAKEKLPVIASFQSAKSLSFTAKIDFLDDDGNRFSVPITGTSDNCILTTYSYVEQRRATCEFQLRPARPVMFVPRRQLARADSAPRVGEGAGGAAAAGGDDAQGAGGAQAPSATAADASTEPPASAHGQQAQGTDAISLAALLRFLNSTVAPTPLQGVPDELAATHGRSVLDLLEAMSGKKLPGRASKLSNRKRQFLLQLLTQYDEMLSFMKAHGALLHHVRPEAFLRMDDYVRVCMVEQAPEHEMPAQRAQRRHALERAHHAVATDAWSAVLYQAVKVFVLHRITQKQYAALPGIQGTPEANVKAPIAAASSAAAAAGTASGSAAGAGVSASDAVQGATAGSAPAAGSSAAVAATEAARRRGRSSRVGDASTAPTPALGTDADGGAAADSAAAMRAAEPALAGSNVYTVPESLLLRWLSVHRARVITDQAPVRLVDFSADLADGATLCAAVLSHAPHLGEPGQPLQQFFRRPQHEDQVAVNMERLNDALRALGAGVQVPLAELRRASPRDMLLLALYLYQTLPHYVPKTAVEFEARLGHKLSKRISLRNPSKQEITYDVALEGSKDFHVPLHQVKLLPGDEQALPVELTARFSKPVEARLTLVARRDMGAHAATMVFLLRSAVRDRVPLEVVRAESPTYEAKRVRLDVRNPFDVECSFKITLVQERTAGVGAGGRLEPVRGDGGPGASGACSSLSGAHEGPAARAAGTSPARRRAGRAGRAGAARSDKEQGLPDAFWSSKTAVKLRAGASKAVELEFMPFLQGEYRCHVIFLDEAVGEFVHEVLGTATLPRALDALSFTTEIKSSVTRELVLPPRNALLDRARGLMVERLVGSTRNKARDVQKAAESRERPPAAYSVEFNSPYFQPQGEVVLGGRAGLEGGRAAVLPPGAAPAGQNRLAFTFHPKAAGVYPCRVVLRSPQDVRVYELEAVVSAAGLQTTLEFTAPARRDIVQDVPLVNNTDAVWVLRARITGSPAFSGPAELRVPPRGTAAYPLRFRPAWVCTAEAKLTLANPATKEEFTYDLRGVGEEPLAEDHVAVPCRAREPATHAFRVRNDRDADVVYRVESDLPHVSGDSELLVPRGRTADYVLRLHPQLGGSYTGSITFRAPDGEFQWFTVELQVGSPEPEQVLDIEAVVRKAVAVEISLGNPLPDAVEFEVVLEGEGLLGDASFLLGPGETATYELIYSPLTPGQGVGSVTFLNDQLGEFWYRLNLHGHPPEPARLEPMRCAVGATAAQPLLLENPSGQTVTLQSQLDNRRNFAVEPPQVVLGPYARTEVLLRFTPSALDEEQQCRATFSHPRLGEWVFLASGVGTLPGTMRPVVVNSPVHVSVSSSFVFRNPFPAPLTVTVALRTPPDMPPGLFALLLKKPKHALPPFATLQIPLVFSPTTITECRAQVEVNSVEHDGAPLRWVYPLHGVAEAPPADRRFSYTTQCRKPVDRELLLALPGLGALASPEQFKHSLEVPDEMRALVEASLFLQPVRMRLLDAETPLQFQVLFAPMRPFSTTVQLVIEKQSGGRWRYAVDLQADEPDVDDVIVIEAAINRTSSVAFQLANNAPATADFRAFFSADSPAEMTVFPTEGTLPPAGSTGTTLTVSFTPREYGKTRVGMLIVQTPLVQWTYEIRGTHPQYVAPVSRAKVSHRLDASTARMLGQTSQRRNVLRDNIQRTATMSRSSAGR